MKRPLLFFVIIGMLTVLFGVSAFAASAVIDTKNIAKGIAAITLEDYSEKTIMAQVEKGDKKYVYKLIKSSVNIPLQMGTGEYKIGVYEGVGGNKYKKIASVAVNAAAIDEKALYTASVPMVEYADSVKAIPAFKEITKGKATDAEKASAIYDYIVRNYSYDEEKAANIKGDYVPAIDEVFDAKKGICFDYSALVGGALRSQGIPAKLVMGYVPETAAYHSWNEIFINGEWISVDATYDALVVKAGREYTMKKDRSKTKIVEVY